MLKHEIEVGRDYAYREHLSTRGKDLLRVTVEALVAKGRWVVLWHEGPEKGKRTSIRAGHLVCDWDDAGPIVEEERRFLALMKASDSAWSWQEDRTVKDAASFVLSCTGELGSEPLVDSTAREGHLEAVPRCLERVCARAGMPSKLTDLDPLGFIDRSGRAHIGFAAALLLAKRFAAAEPDVVLACLRAQTRSNLGDARYVDSTARTNAAYAIARDWTGGAIPVPGGAGDVVRLEDLGDDWIRPLREFQVLALRYTVDRDRYRSVLRSCVDELLRRGAKHIPVEAELMLLELGHPE